MTMKTILKTCCAIALISPLSAGDNTPAPSTAPTTSYESYCWFLGGGADYMFDSEDFYWNGHFGYNLSEASSIFVELGWTGSDEDVTVGLLSTNIDVDIVPLTLNYKYEWALGNNLSWYLGGGLGGASLDIDIQGVASDDDVVFAAQAFTGLAYEFTPAFEGYLGLRYMYFDSTELFGVDVDDLDDFGLGLGLRLNF